MSTNSAVSLRVDPTRAVGLESVIIAHGLPAPENVDVATRCEEIVRQSGAIPATVGIVPREGLVVGLSQEEIEEIGHRNDVVRVNLSNLAATLMRRRWGATSVSTSLYACAKVGIKVFVTGGIGGVHRGFGETFDISADLTALSREPVAVVCAGVKSTLHVAATREHLETLGIPIVGYRTDTLPMFYVRDSDQPVDLRCDSAEEIAEFLSWHFRVSNTSVIIGNPTPVEAAFSVEEMNEALLAIEPLVHAAGGATGRDVTPAELTALREVTNGRSLRTNVALIENNSRLGGGIAMAMDRRDGGS